jgi:hypothetical protein
MSHATTMLAAIEATLESLAANGVASMTINGRTIEYKSSKDLLALRAKYMREVKDEQDEANGVSRIVRAQIGNA